MPAFAGITVLFEFFDPVKVFPEVLSILHFFNSNLSCPIEY